MISCPKALLQKRLRNNSAIGNNSFCVTVYVDWAGSNFLEKKHSGCPSCNSAPLIYSLLISV